MNKKNKLLLTCILATTLSSSMYAENIKVSGSIALSSNYISKGMTQTDDKAALIGELIADYKGFFVGTWASNVDYVGADADVEIDYYVGYKRSFKNLDASLRYSRFTYNSDVINDLDELKLELAYHIDQLTIGASYGLNTWAENDAAKSDYAEVYTSYDFDQFSLKASAGDLENIGTNQTIGISKLFLINNNAIILDLTFSNFEADVISGIEDEKNLIASIIYAF
ncbi:TorF family putative porin [Arcobacter sp.]|uniref:TorF family putative porin n=1 Tax=Arcobacter sp. TaxID=1872629 RepID=UPI003C7762F9